MKQRTLTHNVLCIKTIIRLFIIYHYSHILKLERSTTKISFRANFFHCQWLKIFASLVLLSPLPRIYGQVKARQICRNLIGKKVKKYCAAQCYTFYLHYQCFRHTFRTKRALCNFPNFSLMNERAPCLRVRYVHT